MRKTIAVALAALQLGFLAGIICYRKSVARHLQTDATEYVFAATGSYWAYGNDDRTLRLAIRQTRSNEAFDYSWRYWKIVTGDDGVSVLRPQSSKPSGPYISADDGAEDYFYVHYFSVTPEFEETFFPDLRERYFERIIVETGEDYDYDFGEYYGTEDADDLYYGNVFSIKAKVWKGHIEITDYLVNGQSISDYTVPSDGQS